MTARLRFTSLAACGALLVSLPACNAAHGDTVQPTESEPDVAAQLGTVASPPRASTPAGPATFTYSGELTQGGWIRGSAPKGTQRLWLDEQDVAFAADGHFFAAFDRDHDGTATLRAELADGRSIDRELTIAPRAWNIEHINAARRTGGPSEAFMRIRQPELARIAAARAENSETDGWSQKFIWPVTGRISGRFGSQRIYRGEPGSYHSGIDITTGTSGTTFVAPADGVVVLAAAEPFSLEGYLLMIDHGMGLNSAFLHCSAILVREGDTVKQGEPIGRIGSSGRATGPHLHWSLKWRDARLDPLLFVGPMP